MEEEFVIRPARPEDRPAMERICAHTWESGDYIQEVWDEWLAGENGPLLVVELDTVGVVSLNKVTRHSEGQFWLEGMRVDPEYRGRGIARLCLDWNVAYAREQGGRMVRLSTAGSNTTVHRMVARVGMERVTVAVLRVAPALPGGRGPAILGPEDGDAVARFWRGSPVLAAMGGLYSRDWTWQELSAAALAAMLERGEVVAERAPDGSLSAVATVHHWPGDPEMWVGIADGEPAAVQSLALAIRAGAADAGAGEARAMLPPVPWLREAFLSAGYEPDDWNDELWVYELRLAQDEVGEGERGH